MILPILFHLIAVSVSTQAPSPIEGKYRGTSICIQRNGPCHDEQVVYYIARVGPDSAHVTPLRVTMNKIIDGKEDDMADFSGCTYSGHSLHCPMPPNVRPGDWRFTLTGDKLDGGLWVSGNIKFRDIHLTRVKSPASPK